MIAEALGTALTTAVAVWTIVPTADRPKLGGVAPAGAIRSRASSTIVPIAVPRPSVGGGGLAWLTGELAGVCDCAGVTGCATVAGGDDAGAGTGVPATWATVAPAVDGSSCAVCTTAPSAPPPRTEALASAESVSAIDIRHIRHSSTTTAHRPIRPAWRLAGWL